MTKYQQYFQDMLNQNPGLFDRFREVHDRYAGDPKKFQKEYNEIGREVQDVIRIYENRLCSRSEGGGYGKFSTNLADKFQAEIKLAFPKINLIGLE